jgi:hypothetical protein
LGGNASTSRRLRDQVVIASFRRVCLMVSSLRVFVEGGCLVGTLFVRLGSFGPDLCCGVA